MLVLKGILWMAAALLGITALCWYRLWIEKKAPSDDYDERQKIEQGKANGITMLTGLIYFVVLMCWMERGTLPADPRFLIFVGILLELMVYHIYCLMTHAALPLSRKPKSAIGSYVTLGIIWTLRACMYDPAWGMDLHGTGVGFWRFVLTAFCAFSLAAMHLISYLRDKKES